MDGRVHATRNSSANKDQLHDCARPGVTRLRTTELVIRRTGTLVAVFQSVFQIKMQTDIWTINKYLTDLIQIPPVRYVALDG